jgi:hypothetical protein
MSWDITERFPSWGETGEMPAAGFFYEGGDQVNEKHFDALWNGVKEMENEVHSALDDIDADSDGKVDAAEIADTIISGSVGDGLKGGDGTTISIEPADFAGSNLEDDGNDNLRVVGGDGSGLDADTVDGIESEDLQASPQEQREATVAHNYAYSGGFAGDNSTV